MLSVEDELIVVDFEEVEISSLSPGKFIGNRVIYSSRDLGGGSLQLEFRDSIGGCPTFGLPCPRGATTDGMERKGRYLEHKGLCMCIQISQDIKSKCLKADGFSRHGIFMNRDIFSTPAIQTGKFQIAIISLG